MSIVLLCAVVGAVVAGLTSLALNGPQRRFDRRMAVLKAEALVNYSGLRARLEGTSTCPVCVDMHPFKDSDCEAMVCR